MTTVMRVITDQWHDYYGNGSNDLITALRARLMIMGFRYNGDRVNYDVDAAL